MGMDAPVVNKISYDGTQVKVWWNGVTASSVTGYKILVTSSDSGTVYESELISGRLSNFGILPFSSPLDTNIIYTLQVQSQTASGPDLASLQVAMLTRRPVLRRAVYNGEDLDFEFDPVPETASNGYALRVTSQNSGATYAAEILNPNGTKGKIPKNVLPTEGLDSAQQWLVTVSAQGADSCEACSIECKLPMPLTTLSISNVSYRTGENLLANWQVFSGIDNYVLKVSSLADDTDYELLVPDSAATSGVLSFPLPLYIQQNYVFQLLAITHEGVGVATLAQSIITSVPRIINANYDGLSIALTWQASTNIAVTEYRLKILSLTTGQAFTNTVSGSTTTSGQVEVTALDASQTWVATVSAVADGMVEGQSDQYPLLVQPITINMVAYDGAQLIANWTGIEDDTVVAYRVSLLKNNVIVQSIEENNALAYSAVMPLTSMLDDANFTLQVCAIAQNGASVSAISDALLTQMPSIQYVVYEGNKVVVAWQAYSGVSQFIASVFSKKATAYFSKTENSSAAVSTTIDVPGLLGREADYVFQLSASTNNGIVIKTPLAVMSTDRVSLKSLVYDGTAITGQWHSVTDPVATVTGYQLKVVAQGSGTTFTAQSDNPLETSLTISELGSGLSAVETYQGFLVVKNQNNISTWGDSKVLPAAVPTVSYASYDGTKIQAGWQAVAVSEGTVCGYLMQATSIQNDKNYQIFIPNVAATSGVLPTPQGLNDLQSYCFSVSAVSENDAGHPDGTASAKGVSIEQTIITTRPKIHSININSARIHVTWSMGQNLAVTGFKIKLISLNSGTTYQATVEGGTSTQGSIPIPPGGLDPNQQWVIEVWTEGDHVVSSISDSVALIVQTVQITQLKYDGSIIMAQWTPIDNIAVGGYMLTVTAATSGTVYRAMVIGALTNTAAIELDAALPEDDTYHAVVVALINSVTAGINSDIVMTTTSAGLDLDTNLPATSSVVYADSQVSASWTAVDDTNVTGYSLVVTSEVSGKTFSADIAGRDITHGSVPVEGLLATDENYSFSLHTINPSGALACSGAAAIITCLPTLLNVSYDASGKVAAHWQASADASANLTGFILAVRPPDAITPVNSAAFDNPDMRSGEFDVASVAAGSLLDVRAVADSGVVSVGQSEVIVTDKPVINRVAYDSGIVLAQWDAQAGTHYLFNILDANGSCVASTHAVGGQATVDVNLDPSSAYSAVLYCIDDVTFDLINAAQTCQCIASIGPMSDAVGIIAGTVSMSDAVYDGSTVTVNFSGIPQTDMTTGYTAYLYENGNDPVQGTVTGTQCVFTKVLDVTKQYTVQVQATGINTTGPQTEPLSLVSGVPRLLSASLQGATLQALWQSLECSEISGYQLELRQGNTLVATFNTEHTSLQENVTLDSGGSYTVRIKAISGVAIGTFSDDFPVDSDGFQYYIESAQDTVQPYLFRSLKSTPPTTPAETITLFLPEVFNTPQTESVNPDGPFTLTPTNSTPYVYEINFSDTSAVWTFDNNAVRNSLQASYALFLQALEAVEGGMTEFGLELVREVIALGMPMTFDETLFYRYGFDTANGYCDLQPGMALRLDSETYQFVGTSGSASQVSGFVSTGSSTYDIGAYMASNGERETGINAFLSAAGRPNVSPNSRGSGGVIDLYATSFRRRYYRLFYPQNFVSSDSEGQVGIGSNVAVLGCNSWTVLNEATTSYLATGGFDSVTADISYTFFRGRMVSTPMLWVLLNDVPQQLPLGTTVRELVQRYAHMPMAQGTRVNHISLDRLSGNVVNTAQSTLTLNLSQRDPIRLTVNPFSIVLQQKDAYDLPLLNGDRVTIG